MGSTPCKNITISVIIMLINVFRQKQGDKTVIKKAIIVLAALGSVVLLALLYHGTTHADQWGMVWHDEFTGSAVSGEWDILKQNTDNLRNTHLARWWCNVDGAAKVGGAQLGEHRKLG